MKITNEEYASHGLFNFYHGTPYKVIESVVVNRPHICGLCGKPYQANEVGVKVTEPTIEVAPGQFAWCIFHLKCFEKDQRKSKLYVVQTISLPSLEYLAAYVLCGAARQCGKRSWFTPKVLSAISEYYNPGSFTATLSKLEHKELADVKNPDSKWVRYRVSRKCFEATLLFSPKKRIDQPPPSLPTFPTPLLPFYK